MTSTVRLINIFGGLSLAALVLGGCSREEITLVAPRLEIDQEIAQELVRLFSDPESIVLNLKASPDPSQPGLQMIINGSADIALVSNAEPFHPEVTAVLPLYPTVLHIAHREEIEAGGVLDLVGGHSVFAGPPGSVSRMMLEEAAARAGANIGDIDYVNNSSCAEVIVLFAPVLPDIPERIGECGSYRLLSLGKPADIGQGSLVDSVALLNPQIRPFVIPVDTYGSLTPKPIVTLAVDKLLVARRGLSETLVYDLIGELLRLQPALSATHAGLFHRLSDDFDASGSTFVLHPGSQAFLQRDEPDFYERYSGIAEVLVTMLIGLVSGGFAIVKLYNIRRKNRIDAFCVEAMSIRDGVGEGADDHALVAAQNSLKALQEQAYQLMVEEKLAADESFRIFITLSNDILADLRGSPRSAG